MNEKHLTLKQNTCAARIFLNTFGLTLGNVDDVNELSKIKIFDKTMNEVGELHFDNGKVIMSANYNNSTLEANFDLAKMTGFVDPECKSAPFALFSEWYSKIAFQLKKGHTQTIDGEFIISSTVDSEYGINCICRPLINCTILGGDKVTLRILRDGRTLGLVISSGEYNETIDVMPWDELNGFIKHIITNGKYDQKTYTHEYKRYAGVFNGAERGENKDKLHVFLSEEEHNTQLAYYNEFVPKVGKDNSKETLLQKGNLMQQLDPSMYKKIEELRKILSIGDVSLLDNIVSVCYDSYTDEDIKALLGINRQRMNYQNGANSLINSYYEIGISNCFFPLEKQKRLLKK